MVRNKLIDLNDHLFEQIERLNDDELTDEQLSREIKKSKAIVTVARAVIDNASLALDATKLSMEYADNVNLPKMISEK